MNNTTQPACPSIVELEAFVEGAAPHLAAHVEACAECRDRVEQLRADNALLAQVAGAHAEALPDPTGKPTIEGYEIGAEIHRGGQGVVFRAFHRATNRTVALKVLLEGALATSQQRMRFEREIELAAGLSHPHIVVVHDSGTAGGRHFFTMELIDGRTLLDYVAAHNLDLRSRLRLVERICRAVQYAHDKGVIHRDLKPANILVTPDGEPKILDFGVARATDSDIRATTLQTDIGQIIGTLPYMSPEQVSGDPTALDARSDVYALGVITYELLGRRLPHDLADRSIPDAARVIRDVDPAPLSAVDRSLRGDLDTIVAKALEKDKERRYPTAGAFADDIDRFLRHEPIVARPVSTIYQMRKFARRNRALVGGIAVSFLILVVGIIATSWQAFAATRARDEAKAAQQNESRQREQAEMVTNFLVDMLAAADPKKQGREVRVIDVLDPAAARIGEDFPDRPNVAVSLRVTLGTTYLELGELDKARLQLEQALATARAALPSDDELTGQVINRLAVTYMHLGRLDDAEGMLGDLVDMRRRTLGEDDPATLTAINNLASVRRQLGKLDEVEPLYVELLEAARRAFGPEHRNTLVSMSNLADVYMDQERYADAAALFEETVEACRRELGDGDPDTLMAIYNLSGAYVRQERLDDAESVLLDGAQRAGEALGAEHSMTLDFHNRLAYLYGVQKRYELAEERYRTVLAVRRRVLPENHFDTFLSIHGLARTLIGREQYDEAETLANELHDRSEHVEGPPDALRRRALTLLVDLYDAWGKTAEADEWRARMGAP